MRLLFKVYWLLMGVLCAVGLYVSDNPADFFIIANIVLAVYTIKHGEFLG